MSFFDFLKIFQSMPRNPRVSTRGKISQAEVYVLVLLDTWIDSLLDDSEEVSLVYEHSWLLDHTRRKYCYWWICCFLMCCGFCLWKNWPNTNKWWRKLILESLSLYLPSCEGILPQQTGLKSHHLYRDHRNQEKENHEWTVWLHCEGILPQQTGLKTA